MLRIDGMRFSGIMACLHFALSLDVVIRKSPRWGNVQETRTPCGQFVPFVSSPSHSTSHVSASYSFSAHTAPSAL